MGDPSRRILVSPSLTSASALHYSELGIQVVLRPVSKLRTGLELMGYVSPFAFLQCNWFPVVYSWPPLEIPFGWLGSSGSMTLHSPGLADP